MSKEKIDLYNPPKQLTMKERWELNNDGFSSVHCIKGNFNPSWTPPEEPLTEEECIEFLKTLPEEDRKEWEELFPEIL